MRVFPARLLPLILVLALGGCFISQKPLIGPKDAEFPFATFTYRSAGSEESYTFVREADAYVPKPGSADVRIELRMRKLPSGHYLVQMKGDQKKGTVYLYMIAEIDFAKGTAAGYKALRREADIGPGLRDCPDQAICIDDLAAYIALGEAAIARGEPDARYTFTGEP